MATTRPEANIDEYLRRRLMPVEGSVPRLAGIDMYGNSIPVGSVGGDLFEYINFQQRYNLDARVWRALFSSPWTTRNLFQKGKARETRWTHMCDGWSPDRNTPLRWPPSTEGRNVPSK